MAYMSLFHVSFVCVLSVMACTLTPSEGASFNHLRDVIEVIQQLNN